MCGICGFVTRHDTSLEQLKIMNDTMVHRGPDDRGEELYLMKKGYTMGMAHRRLSILDLSLMGHQPVHSPCHRVSVVCNGEIYNFRELKEQLSDYPFRSSCDTEVIVAAYLKWGIDCVEKLNGMFAIALFDREEDAVYLIRDRIGKKTLYYYAEDGALVFASELKPIMKYPGFQRRVRADVLPRYLCHQYINAPDSIFENVYKLEPGMVLRFRYGEIKKWKYWDVKEVYHSMRGQEIRSYAEAKEGLKERLKKSVADRMIADVPLGSFLSGGYDSSLVTAIAQEHASHPVRTFSIGFHEEAYDEAKYAAQVADHLGTDHTELYIDEEEMFRQVAAIPRYFDEPFADSSQIPTMLVSRLAKEQVTVALSGDGGDEFFCGYNLYDHIRKAQMLDPLGGFIYGAAGLKPLEKFHLLDRVPMKVRVIAQNRDREAKTQFAVGSYSAAAQKMMADRGENETCLYLTESAYGVDQWQIRRMLLDMETYLPGDILCKVDRASMKYSLEARCPILDREVMEYSYRIPHRYKYFKGDKKHILKDIAYDYIPKELLDRPKTGFSVPLDKWLRGPLKSQLLDYSNKEYLRKQGLFDPEGVYQMAREYLKAGDGGSGTGENYSRVFWSFLVFQEWYQTYCVGDHF